MERDKKIKDQIQERIKEKKRKRKPYLKEFQQENEKGKGDGNKSPNKSLKRDESSEASNFESDEVDSVEESDEDDEEDEDDYIKKKHQGLPDKYLTESLSKNQQDEEHDIDSQDDDDDDNFYSDEDEDSQNHSPVQRPNDLKGLLKHKQKKSKFDIKLYQTENPDQGIRKGSTGKNNQIRTLDQMLSMIQNDIIHEEKFENDSNSSIGSSSSGTS